MSGKIYFGKIHAILWEKITGRLTKFYDEKKAEGKKLRMMTAVVIVSRFYQISDRGVVKQVKENRYIQYFCNVANQRPETFLHPASLYYFRKRIGEKGCAVIEKEVFEMLRRAGVTEGDTHLTDSTVLNSNIIWVWLFCDRVHLISRKWLPTASASSLLSYNAWLRSYSHFR